MTEASPLLSMIVSGVGFLFAVMLTTGLSGKLVKMGAGYGKILLEERFQSFPRLFFVFLFEAVLLSAVFTYLEPIIDQWLWFNVSILPSIVTEAFVIYYVWFCMEFSYSLRWKWLVLPQIIVALNYFFGIGTLAFLAK